MAFKKTTTTAFQMNHPDNMVRILVDCKSVLYVALLSSLRDYEIESDIKNSTYFRFWNKLQIAARTFKTNRLIFCWDSETSIRKTIFPAYKEGRDKPNDPTTIYRPFFKEIETEILPKLGFANSFNVEGLEGDDIMAIICKQEKKMPLAIFSDDGDMYQLISNRVYHMSVKGAVEGKKPKVFTVARFVEMFGIDPSRWAEVLSLSGCTIDCVPGVESVGKIGAVDFLNGTLKKCMKRSKIEQSKDVIDFTRRLVQLPVEGSPESLELKVDSLSYAEFVRQAKRFNCDQLVENGFWKSFFGEK